MNWYLLLINLVSDDSYCIWKHIPYMPHHFEFPLLIYCVLYFAHFVGAGGELQEAAQGGEERRGLSPGAPQVHDYHPVWTK
jgi:hypothetical protein